MPGYFLTFIFLCFAGAWSRMLADRTGSNWPMYIPGIGFAIWMLLLVFGITSGYLVVGDGSDLQADTRRINRVYSAAVYARYLSITTLLLMVPVTALAWLRPAQQQAPNP